MERRLSPRKRPFATQQAFSVQAGTETFSARLVDWSETGFGLETARRLDVGCRLNLKGELAQGAKLKKIDVCGVVGWSRSGQNGKHLCGVVVNQPCAASPGGDQDEDYYELLQLSSNADPDTIHRVFRILAQRFHPDNPETGDEACFKSLLQAYEVLRDPVSRAAYDAKRPERQKRWKIFETAAAAQGIEGERRKRHGILWLLYVRRMSESRDPGLSPIELERLLGCPREHLEFTLWFLKENAWITRSDNGRVTITAKGVDQAESLGDFTAPENRMLAASV